MIEVKGTNNAEIAKISSAPSNGLLSTDDSLSYRIAEIDRHLHGWERWFEVAAIPSGETHVADCIGLNGGTPFQLDAGNDDWGSWVQILGSSDTPCITDMVKYDLHRLQVVAAERTSEYFIEVAFGTSGAQALTDETFSVIPFKPQTVQGKAAPVETMARRRDAGVKAWARCICPGQNTATIDFYFGLHEYEG